MVEFAQTYGLWIALAGVFIAMHWFGMGCCGGRHGLKPTQRDENGDGGDPKGQQPSQSVRKSSGGCH